MISPTICQLPFTQQMIESNGEIKTCCAILPTYGANKDQNDNPYNVMTHTLSDAWNSGFMRQLRLDLIDGKEPNCCQTCWKHENKDHTQGTSVRFSNANKFPISKWQDRVEYAKNNQGYLEQKAFDFQLATGNLCNLACKMCSPRYSTTYSKFFKKFGIKNSMQANFQKNKLIGTSVLPLDIEYIWPTENSLVKIFENNIDEIELIFLTGGEPTLIEENLVFLEHLIQIKASDHIRIHINTNCTNINQRLLNIMSEFNEIWLNLSIDGIDDIAYLQRTPSNWKQIEKNLDTLIEWKAEIELKLKKIVRFNILSTITELNLHHIIDAWYHLSNRYDFNVSCNPIVYEPLGINKIPSNVSKKIYDHLIEMENKFPKNYRTPVAKLKYWLEQDIYQPTYDKIHYTLSELQRFHPDMNIKEIYKIYYD